MIRLNAPALRLAALALGLLAVSPVGAAAQTASEVAHGYAEEALERNLGLREAGLSIEVARARLAEARSAFRPALAVEARYTRAEGGRNLEFPVGDLLNPVYDALNGLVGTPNQPAPFARIENVDEPLIRPREQDTRLRVTQLLYAPAASRAVAAEVAGVEVREAEVDARGREVVRSVETAYFRWLNADRAVRILDDALDLVVENERVVEALLQEELTTPDRVFRARAERLDVEQRLADARAIATDAADAFNYLLARDPGEEIQRPIESEDETTRLLTEARALLDGTSRNPGSTRPELGALEAAVRAADEGISAAHAERLPTLALALDAGIQGEDYGFGSDDRFVLGSLVLSWSPFQGGGVTARAARQRAEREALATRQEDTRRLIRLEVDRARRALEVALVSVETAEARALEAERAFRLVARRQAEGLATQVEFLDARAALTAARLNLSITLDAVRIRMADTRYATGLDLPVSEETLR